VEVAECSGAFLDIGFLEEDGVGPLGVAVADVETAFFEEFFFVFFDAGFAKAGAEGLE